MVSSWLISLFLTVFSPLSIYSHAPVANHLFVAPFGSNDQLCSRPEAPCQTVERAVEVAAPGDTIYVASGIYTGSGTAVVRIEKSITLSGGWNEAFTTQDGATILDGKNERRVVFIGDADVTMDRFIIQHGRANSAELYAPSEFGSGILIVGRLTLTNSAVVHNIAGLDNHSGGHGGGGILIYNVFEGRPAELHLTNSTVSGNRVHPPLTNVVSNAIAAATSAPSNKKTSGLLSAHRRHPISYHRFRSR